MGLMLVHHLFIIVLGKKKDIYTYFSKTPNQKLNGMSYMKDSRLMTK